MRLAEFESALVPKMAMAFAGIAFEFALEGLGSHGVMSLFAGAMVNEKRGEGPRVGPSKCTSVQLCHHVSRNTLD